MDEASKTLEMYSDLLKPFLHGRILDIGAGVDPITRDAEVFDKEQGDAQELDKFFPPASFDTVFSSHCLEHMWRPKEALYAWYSLLKPGGTLIVLVPDEDLYEQGHFPSIFNSDHKATFTLSKSVSWSPVSFNCIELANDLGGEVLYIALQSDNYDLTKRTFNKDGILKYRLLRQLLRIGFLNELSYKMRLRPIDQTSRSQNVLAQNCLIVRKLQNVQ